PVYCALHYMNGDVVGLALGGQRRRRYGLLLALARSSPCWRLRALRSNRVPNQRRDPRGTTRIAPKLWPVPHLWVAVAAEMNSIRSMAEGANSRSVSSPPSWVAP